MQFSHRPLSSITLAIALAGATGSAIAAKPIVVRIAHVAPLSGPQAHFGKDNENGMRIAQEELNARGVKIGAGPSVASLSPSTPPLPA